MPLSGVISSYDQARFGASVSIPSSLAQPLTAPGAGKEGRPRAERPLREGSERAPERVADDGAETSGVGRVDVAVERGGERFQVPVEDRPVDEQQPLLGAARAWRLPEVGQVAATDGLEARALRNVDVPEEVVLDERRAGSMDEHDTLLGEPW